MKRHALFQIMRGILLAGVLQNASLAYAGTWLDQLKANLHAQSLGRVSSESEVIIAEFQGHTFPLNIWGDETYASFKIEDCMQLDIQVHKGVLHGYVPSINTSQSNCPLPSVRKGTFVLDLIDQMSQTAGVAFVRLSDESTIKCESGGETVDLPLLRIFQKGQSWYGSHGYQVESPSRERYQAAVSDLRNTPLSQLRKKLPELRDAVLKFQYRHSNSLEAKRLARAYGNDFEKLQEWLNTYGEMTEAGSGEKTLGSFLSWVWTKDCSYYSRFIRLIFPRIEARGLDHYNWINAFRVIEKYGVYLTKYYIGS